MIRKSERVNLCNISHKEEKSCEVRIKYLNNDANQVQQYILCTLLRKTKHTLEPYLTYMFDKQIAIIVRSLECYN